MCGCVLSPADLGSLIMTKLNDSGATRAVTFSEYSALFYYHCHNDKSSTYSSKDMYHFRRMRLYDVYHVRSEINKLPNGDIMTHEQLLECLGIEMFVRNDAARSVRQARRAHIAAVLSEQVIQKQIDIFDSERLSKVSQISSRMTVEKAHKLAMGYAALLME